MRYDVNGAYALIKIMGNKSKLTKGAKSLLNYLKSVIESESFAEDLKTLRVKYLIPDGGFNDKKYLIKNANPYSKCIIPPSWEGKDKIKDWDEKLHTDVRDLRLKYNLSNQFDHILAKLFFFNWEPQPDSLLRSGFDLCTLSDLPLEDELRSAVKYAFTNSIPEVRRVDQDLIVEEKDTRREFPVSIAISPYASINEIIDFVRRSKDSIRHLQSKYKNQDSKIGKIRTRSTQERNAFVLEHKDKPRKKISEMVRKKYGGNVDEIYVRNIISKESKRRKKL